jgi:hypothetical protein
LEKENKRLKEIIKKTNMQTASKRANDETARVLVLQLTLFAKLDIVEAR